MAVVLIMLLVFVYLLVRLTVYLKRQRLIDLQIQVRNVHPLFARPSSRNPSKTSHILIVLGSGGHTAEMLSMLRTLEPQRYSHRTYVFSSGDALSASRAAAFENQLYLKTVTQEEKEEESTGTWEVVEVPRARNIHQPLWSTPLSALICLKACFSVLYPHGEFIGFPDLILTNGPGTGVIVVMASLVLKVLGVSGTRDKMSTIYVESWARVSTLSLSGRLLLYNVNRFFVQWDGLKGKGGRAEYRGFLVQ